MLKDALFYRCYRKISETLYNGMSADMHVFIGVALDEI